MKSVLYRVGKGSGKHRRLVITVWMLILAASIVLLAIVGMPTVNDLQVPGSSSEKAQEIIDVGFPLGSGTQAFPVIVVKEGTFSDKKNQEAVAAITSAWAKSEYVQTSFNPVASVGGGFVSTDKKVLWSTVVFKDQLQELGNKGAADIKKVGAAAVDKYSDVVEVIYTGPAIVETESPAVPLTALIGLILALIIIVVVFGSVLSMLISFGAAVVGILISFALTMSIAKQFDIPTLAPTIGLMLGLGLGITYALLVLDREREHRYAGHPVEDAVGHAVATAGYGVVVATLIIIIASLALFMFGLPLMNDLAILLSIVAFVSMMVSITLLPAFLAIRRVPSEAGRIPGRHVHKSHSDPSKTVSGRWAAHVSHERGLYLVLGIAILVILAVPVLSIETGPTSTSEYSKSTPARQAYDYNAEAFENYLKEGNAGGAFNTPFIVAGEAPGKDHKSENTQVSNLIADFNAEDGVALATGLKWSKDNRYYLFIWMSANDLTDPKTTDTWESIQRDIIPAFQNETDITSYQGDAASTVIILDGRTEERIGWYILAVLLIGLVLGIFTTRSIVVSIKAGVLALLSFGAALGVTVAVFNWGWLRDLVGIDHTGPIFSLMPPVLFAILFGLSLVFEIATVERIHEEYNACGDPRQGVVAGISKTARVVLGSAVVMAVIYLGFVGNTSYAVKTIAFSLGVGVLIDAVVVRLLLLPAVMSVVGRANWWVPRWLDRILPDLGAGTLDYESDAERPAETYLKTPAGQAPGSSRSGEEQ